jgi:hypothetical protein
MMTFREALGLLLPSMQARGVAQLTSVALVILSLLFFQTMIVGLPSTQATLTALGLALVIVGLPGFMAGMVLGLMPLGEVIGMKVPHKATTPIVLAFACILGSGATFAEPAGGVRKAAGASVKAWAAPLRFLPRPNAQGQQPSPARERCRLMVRAESLPALRQAMEKSGARTDNVAAMLDHGEVPKAFTSVAARES